ncbi:aminotransferase class I/II-fold pyridoxal phosphate-dependent enzyme [Chitinophaga horti]|uniref:Aminotransferase class I/II-fold pyridoxal phosphate-dependent enzyme n=1 Tax=Chitinophaga horti TaxID=2920382 RepID=A0ABY6IYJ9_9BACT|nr:aminotransferase class I/II-fold pyridoxal phosphate-dependent enzyme [Chitinophaga horti]UYQ91089.1 aminotransferase class I/II-fold pyridoxal phosphate-dependent enzyme [Chitinophaga horti]
MHLTDQTPGRTVVIDNREHLFFSGFAYLGVHRSAQFQALIAAGLGRYGSLFPSSRIANVQLSLYDELEHAFCALQGQQAAACFSSGYLAGQAAIRYGQTKGEVLYAPGTHPALQLPGAVVPTGDWAQWALERINQKPDHTYVIAADSVNPLTATVNDFSALQHINRKTLVIIDDSHGIGILGEDGEGIISYLPENPHLHYLVTASTGKAYSMEGGIITGKAADIAAIKRMPAFTASTPMMPALAYAWLNSQSIYAEARRKLEQNAQYFRDITLGMPQLTQAEALPMFILNGAQEVYDYLLHHETVISSFRYPSPDSPRLNRVVLSALHLQQDLETVAGLLKRYYSA